MASQSCGRVLTRFFEYDTPQMLHTNSKIVGIMFRILQLVIFGFIFAYYIGYKQGYQEQSNVIVSTSRLTAQDAEYSSVPDWSFPVFLTMRENDNTFIPTGAIEKQQIKSICVESRDVRGALCDPYRNHCKANAILPGGNGVMTGRCVSSKGSTFLMTLDPDPVYYGCEIKGWCLTNKTEINVAEALNVKDMVLTIENDIYFPRFPNERKLNNYKDTALSCLKNKHYYSEEHPLCPTFKIGDILKTDSIVDGKLVFSYKDIVRTGGVYMIIIKWDCNFDVPDATKDCSTKYSIRRMDIKEDKLVTVPDMKFATTLGNIRYIVHVVVVRFIVTVEGSARKFNMFTFLTRMGASFGLFAIAAVVCEVLIIFSCCSRERQVKDFKFVNMESQLLQKKELKNRQTDSYQ